MNRINNIFNTNLRFNEVAIGAETLAALTLVIGGESSHHHDFNGLGFWSGTQNIKHIEARNFWHHHI